MIKQVITFEDFNGNSRTEEFWFHLSKSELVEMELANNGFGEYLQRIIAASNGRAIMDEFKKIILGAYGIRSDDGRRFIKSPEISLEFSQTPAYDQLFLQLVTNAQFSSDFINGLVPADLAAQVRAEAQTLRKAPQDHQPKQPTQTVFQQPQESWTGQPASQTPPPDQGYIQAPPHESGPGYYQGPPQQQA